jgi:hypothetical protein
MFTRIRGASNEKAKRELGWRLTHRSRRESFEHGLTERSLVPDSVGP